MRHNPKVRYAEWIKRKKALPNLVSDFKTATWCVSLLGIPVLSSAHTVHGIVHELSSWASKFSSYCAWIEVLSIPPGRRRIGVLLPRSRVEYRDTLRIMKTPRLRHQEKTTLLLDNVVEFQLFGPVWCLPTGCNWVSILLRQIKT